MDGFFPTMPPNIYPEWSDARHTSSNADLLEPKVDLFYLMRSYQFPLPPLHSDREFPWTLERSPLSDDEKRDLTDTVYSNAIMEHQENE
ncbi:uncharacterized protein LOC26526945 [Drosophila erecta]|uniref:Uncharacterized protein n=1 Tax=Drosophila erecta TaxID=7220 RepID=A0A0Q5U2A9_DROER|nr:uncharacterized protein LOC26526945 [Drosophila erecta]KQS43134.1 uncharacterized protein Dere_GG27121 [Drosophila erecta]